MLNEFEVAAAPKADPKQSQPVKLRERRMADFSQDGFDVAARSTATPNQANNGWAISPMTGAMHWATFETAEPSARRGARC